MRDSTVTAGAARTLLDMAVSKGASRQALADAFGIDPLQLDDQDNRIPVKNYILLMRAAKELCNDPALALHYGEVVDFSDISIVGLIGRASETMAAAFEQLNRYSRLVVELDTGKEERFRFIREGDRLWMVDNRPNPNEFPELAESTFARMVCTSRRWFGRDFAKAVYFTHAEPAYRAEYDRIFRVPVFFESDKNAVLTDESWAEQKGTSSSRYVFGILTQHADELLKRLSHSSSTRDRVEAELIPILHTGNASVERIAHKMGMSRQTLFRRLKEEGTGFGQILDRLRHKMAVDYLSGKRVSVNETAYLVGFSEPAAFSRAFKRWTGISPRTSRRSIKPLP